MHVKKPIQIQNDISLSLCIKMVGSKSVKLFRFIQKCCHAIGIKSHRSHHDEINYNSTKSVFLGCLAQFAVTSMAFLVYDAQSMSEYSSIFYGLISTLKATIDFFILTWRLEEIAKFIENCEAFIEKSE